MSPPLSPNRSSSPQYPFFALKPPPPPFSLPPPRAPPPSAVAFAPPQAQDTEGKGLRGTTYVRLDAAGRIAHVMEAAEPLVKPGGSTAALLKAIAKPRPVDPEAANWARRTPTEGADIVQYLWREVPQGAPGAMEEALSFFADDIVYEDFNFPEPFKGKPAVREFLKVAFAGVVGMRGGEGGGGGGLEVGAARPWVGSRRHSDGRDQGQRAYPRVATGRGYSRPAMPC